MAGASLWGIDLGGTKIEGVVLPAERGTEPICRIRIPTEADQGYEHIVERIATLIEMMERDTATRRPARIGFGTPGTADPTSGRMKNCNTTVMNGRTMPRDISHRLGVEAVVANDANCLALAEATLGVGAGCDTVFGVILGTGVGGGMVVHGRVLNGAQGIAGEWGHNVLEPDGAPCYCGKRGCVETVLSGPRLERFYSGLSGVTRRLPDIVARATEGGDAAATSTLDRLCEKFGEAMSVVVNIFDPDAIVLGGGVGNVPALYSRGRDALERWVFNDKLGTKLLQPTLGDSAGVFGAAMLVRD